LSRFIFHPQAKKEMEDAIAWYESQSYGLGDRFQRAVENALSQIELRPLAYPKVRSRWRRVLLPRFPYGIIYLPAGETIYILSIFHGSRNPRHWRKRL
jgi:plasmid stabilization system protein ParE